MADTSHAIAASDANKALTVMLHSQTDHLLAPDEPGLGCHRTGHVAQQALALPANGARS